MFTYERKDSELVITYWNPKLKETANFTLSDENGDLSQSSFVVDWVAWPGRRETGPSCQDASSSELRSLIVSCNGQGKLRALNAEEKSEMDAFKNDVQGGFNCSLRSMAPHENQLTK